MKKTFLIISSFFLFTTNVFADVIVNKPVTFSAKASGGLTYEWTFPKGTKMNGAKVTYVFQEIGTQEIKLVVSDGLNSKELVKSVLVRNEEKPTAVIQIYKNGKSLNKNNEVVQVMRSDELQFVSDSVNIDGSTEGLVESWKLDSRTVSSESISGMLKNVGTYKVKLIVVNKENPNFRDEKEVSVEIANTPPKFLKPLSFEKDSVLGSANVIVSTLAEDEDGEISYYRFEVLEYGTVVSAKISKTNEAAFNLSQFSGEHQYKFKAVAMDNNGASVEIFSDELLTTDEFFKNSAPKVGILISPSTVGNTLTNFMFQAEASDLDGDALDYKWTFPENENKFYDVVNYRFTTPGVKEVKLEVSDGIAKAETSLKVNILELDTPAKTNSRPLAYISGVTPGNTGNTDTLFSFYSEASDIDDDQLSYEWSFGDGQKMFVQNVSYKFSMSGNYNVKLKVSDGLEVVERVIPITVVNVGEIIPVSTITPYEDLHNSSSLEDGIYIDSANNLKQNLEDKKNELELELKTITDPDKRAEIEKNSLSEIFGFDFITIRGNVNTVFFVYGKAPQSERALFFEWDLGDGRKQIGQNVSVRYKETGIYTLQLKVSDGLTTAFDSLKIKVEKIKKNKK
jgi:PKD repeat protein